MIVYRIRRFFEAWAEEDATVRVFLAWNAANTVVAFLLLVGAFALLVATSAPGFQRSLLLGYIAVAVGWLLSIFVIGPAYERVVPHDEE
ncbi:hypothetical protein BRC64_04255 [Halobacteriales archaeon QH_10_67_22]|jgi:ABC-type multidrug transport system fused ATPase/permease subunit|nr:MAG: hypothetical protein BRC64_04255 [Halobacteriales archaeon QH_10_67_22]